MTVQVEIFELTRPECVHTYGTAPCTAVLGPGGKRCYNSPATCQDPANYLAGETPIRWITSNGGDFNDAIPSIKSISVRPQQINPGEDIGVRESISVTFADHPYDDYKLDRYRGTRYAWQVSTFWRKWAARWPNLKGCKCRVLRGDSGAPEGAMKINHYVVDTTTGPDSSGNYTINAKDPLYLLDGENAMVPGVSEGSLLADITSAATTATLSPVGVGGTYPATGVASMGDELVRYSISGDVVTFVERGYRSSKIGEHKAGETFQWAYGYTNRNAAYIISELINSWTRVENEWLDTAVWEAEVTQFAPFLYTGIICKPEPVKRLVNELVKQAGLIFFSDTEAKKIRLRVLRDQPAQLAITDGQIVRGSFSGQHDYDTRVTNVLFYYGQINPLEKVDEEKNYKAILNTVSTNPLIALENTPPAVQKILSRWIPLGGQDAAEFVSENLITRYSRPPRKCSLAVFYKTHPQIGTVVDLTTEYFVDSEGNPQTGKFLITRSERDEEQYKLQLEEINLQKATGGTSRTVYIDADITDANLKALHDSLFLPAVSGNTVTFALRNGAVLRGRTVNSGWAAGVNVVIDFISGRIVGRGGNGARLVRSAVFEQYTPPTDGGTALETTHPVTLNNPKVWGGGGGGSVGIVSTTPPTNFSEGGGGAGEPPGGSGATSGTGFDPGEGDGFGVAKGADGGAHGQPGDSISGQTVGAAGKAIVGISFVTITGTSDIRGPTI